MRARVHPPEPQAEDTLSVGHPQSLSHVVQPRLGIICRVQHAPWPPADIQRYIDAPPWRRDYPDPPEKNELTGRR